MNDGDGRATILSVLHGKATWQNRLARPLARRLDAVIDRIDEWGAATGLCAGAGLGLGGGLLLLWPGHPAGFAAAGLCLSGAAALVLTARPRAGVEVLPGLLPIQEPLEMIELPGGAFLMGSSPDDPGHYPSEAPVHEVTLSPFAMAKHLTTQALYREITGVDPGDPSGDDLPVNKVNWRDAVSFCNRLSERVGLRPCYRIEGDHVEWDRDADGYRLPTEAEWEYAARAGTRTAYSFGDDAAPLGEHAWYGENSEGQPRPVGQKAPSPLGLHDMHGNLWEWCWDWFARYEQGPITDPTGPSDGSERVLRGGSFNDVPRFLRSADRNWIQPVVRNWFFGFRCVRGSRIR